MDLLYFYGKLALPFCGNEIMVVGKPWNSISGCLNYAEADTKLTFA